MSGLNIQNRKLETTKSNIPSRRRTRRGFKSPKCWNYRLIKFPTNLFEDVKRWNDKLYLL